MSPSDGRLQRQDLLIWLALAACGLIITWVAVRSGAALGTGGAPVLGSYDLEFAAASLAVVAIAAAVLVAARRGIFDRLRFVVLLLVGWAGTAAWGAFLALTNGWAGFTRSLESPDNYLTDVPAIGGDLTGYLKGFAGDPGPLSVAARGHPPGPVVLLWALHNLGITAPLGIGVLLTVVGALVTPLVLGAVRGVCGEPAARRYAPVLILAPYAVWAAVSVEVIVAVLAAATAALGVRASTPGRTGLRAGGWALASGATLGVAALFSYAAPWLGLSVLCLYFARRRAFLNLPTGLGALLPLLAAQAAGFSWLDGLFQARADYLARVAHRSALWWGAISLVVLLLAAGPPLVRSLRRLRNTPGWPFMVGAGLAVAFAVLTGLARGGVEAAWLPFFPWLTVAAVAPVHQAGPAPPSPLLLVGAGAATAIIIETMLVTPW